ncbi:ABC transporter substrate-binding protein, partial [Escherichia coli]|uniref:ABC transporter substrate-binding protein n=1 Tax=Escherichia coli TaxID=562 RepID=UPI003F83AA2F
HAADDARGFLAQNTAGSGPFMLKSWQKGQQLVLVPNPHYPGKFPKDLKIDAPDEHTVKFTLSQPFAPFLYTLANDGASIINPAV